MPRTTVKPGPPRKQKAARKPLKRGQEEQATVEQFEREGMGVAAKE